MCPSLKKFQTPQLSEIFSLKIKRNLTKIQFDFVDNTLWTSDAECTNTCMNFSPQTKNDKHDICQIMCHHFKISTTFQTLDKTRRIVMHFHASTISSYILKFLSKK